MLQLLFAILLDIVCFGENGQEEGAVLRQHCQNGKIWSVDFACVLDLDCQDLDVANQGRLASILTGGWISLMCHCFKTASKTLEETRSGQRRPNSSSTARRQIQEAELEFCSSKTTISSFYWKICKSQEHKDWIMEDWSRVMWPDKSKVNMLSSGRVRYVRIRWEECFDTKYMYGTIKHGRGTIMVWRCMSVACVGRM